MSVLYRLKERVETDLKDEELQAMIDETLAEIEARFGVNASISELVEGRRSFLSLHRLIDETKSITVVEIQPANTGDAGNETTLAADDYRIRHGGRIVERLIDGTNGANDWAPLVRLTYTPISDQMHRDEVVIRVVQVDLNERGLAAQKAGDYAATYRDATAERERLIDRLAPKGRMVMA